MSDRVRLSLDRLYVAIENLLLNVDDGDGHATEVDDLLALAADMRGAITEYWQALDIDGKHYTGTDGGFELQQVASGEVELRLWSARARSRGYADFNVTVKVEPGGTTDAGTLEAKRKPAGNQPAR